MWNCQELELERLAGFFTWPGGVGANQCGHGPVSLMGAFKAREQHTCNLEGHQQRGKGCDQKQESGGEDTEEDQAGQEPALRM